MFQKHLYALPLAALMVGLIAGCQSSGTSASAPMAESQRAVVVSGGNGGGTAVFLPSSDPNNPTVLCDVNTPVCPECKAAAIKYFQTGVLEPKCSRTGAIRKAVLIPTEPSNGAHD
jgi:hypothetical protein